MNPKPVLTPLSLTMPVALPDSSSGDLEDASAQAALSVSLAAAATANIQDDNEMSAAHDLLRSAQAAADKAVRLLITSTRPTLNRQLLLSRVCMSIHPGGKSFSNLG